MTKPEKHVFVCTQSRPSDHPKGSCTARGGKELADAFAREFESRGLWGQFKLNTSSCLGGCEEGPAILVYPEGTMYGKVKTEDVIRIIETHLIGDQPIDELKVSADLWE
jgi:(2Fe-2S) ferredoxin